MWLHFGILMTASSHQELAKSITSLKYATPLSCGVAMIIFLLFLLLKIIINMLIVERIHTCNGPRLSHTNAKNGFV